VPVERPAQDRELRCDPVQSGRRRCHQAAAPISSVIQP
jgi:hypothetical protein